MSSPGQFRRYSQNTFITQLLNLLLFGIATILIARMLGPQGQGQVMLLLLIPNLAITFGQFGMVYATNYYAGKVPEAKIMLNALILVLALGLILMLISQATVFFLRSLFFKGLPFKYLFAMSFSIPLYFLFTELAAIMQSRYQINKRNIVFLTQPMVFLIVIFIYVFSFRLGIGSVIISWFISLAIATSLSLFLVSKDTLLTKKDFDPALIKKMLTFGIKAHIGNIFKQVAYRGDMFLVNYFQNQASVGFYSIAVKVGEVLWDIPEAIGVVLLPKSARADKSTSRVFTPMLCRVILPPVLIMCLLLAFFSKTIITVAFGYEYLPSYPALLFLLPGILVLVVWKMLATDLVAQGYPLDFSFTSVIGALVMVILDVALIPKYGINGAAFASTVSYFIATALIIRMYIRRNNVALRDIFILNKADLLIYKSFYSDLRSKLLTKTENCGP